MDTSLDPPLARLLTEHEIAVEARHWARPGGAPPPGRSAVADAGRDLGIVPGEVDRGIWDESNLAVISCGGMVGGVLDDLNRRFFAFLTGGPAGRADAAWPAPPPPANANDRHQPALERPLPLNPS